MPIGVDGKRYEFWDTPKRSILIVSFPIIAIERPRVGTVANSAPNITFLLFNVVALNHPSNVKGCVPIIIPL